MNDPINFIDPNGQQTATGIALGVATTIAVDICTGAAIGTTAMVVGDWLGSKLGSTSPPPPPPPDKCRDMHIADHAICSALRDKAPIKTQDKCWGSMAERQAACKNNPDGPLPPLVTGGF